MSNVTVERDVMVEMRDGVSLATDIYRPTDATDCPTIVQRNPYDKSNAGSVGGLIVNPLDAAEEGFAVVVQDTRGRFKSEGDWEPFVNEAEDGYDTVEWAAAEDWSNGRVGVYGSSYHGVTALQAVISDPPHLESALAYVTGSNYHDGFTYSGGAFELGFNIWWSLYLATDTATRLDVAPEEREERLQEIMSLTGAPEAAARQRPLTENPVFDHPATEYVQDWLDHPRYDDYWEAIDVTERIRDVDIPVLHATGWYDLFLPGHLELYDAIQTQAGSTAREEQRLIIGPWDHEAYATLTPDRAGERKFGYEAAGGTALMSDLSLQWFGYWLTDGGSIDDVPHVRYFQMGEDRWLETGDWPPAHTKTAYYLHSGGNAGSRGGDGWLSRDTPQSEPADSYEYDPADPVPSTGGRTLHINMGDPGVQDRSVVEEREDVLVYSTPRITSPVSIAGPVDATIFASSSAPDTDFTATLVDVEADGTPIPIAEGVIRARYRDSMEQPSLLAPGEVAEFDIDLRAVAHTFREGHRIRLEISSSNFPRFDPNPNVPTDPAEASYDEAQPAVQNVFHSEDYPSRIELPITEM